MDTGTSGDRCTILPNDSNTFPLTMPLTGGDSIESVTLTGLNHTWVGDVQIVLVDPNGIGYNLCARINADTMTCTGFGDSSDFGGDYTFVPAGGGGDILADATANALVTPGSYDQFYGVWVDGAAGVFNTDLGSIPAIPGLWELTIFDGGGGEVGNSIVSSGMTGSLSLPADLANTPTTGFGHPSGVAATPNQRLFIQFWYRDFVGGMATSNLSNALLVIPTM